MATRSRRFLSLVPLLILTAWLLTACSGPGDAGTPQGPSQPPAGTELPQQTGSVPGELVGRWNGGSNEAGHWYYDFFPDGTYRAWPAYQDNPRIVAGMIDVSGSRMTFSNGGNPITVEWYISGGLLYMNGYSYVRA